MSTHRFLRACINYWDDSETNFFSNYIDASVGVVVLVIFPLTSLITTLVTKPQGWAAYTFPILSICAAGIYDCVGRYFSNHKTDKKMLARAALDILAAFCAATCTSVDFNWRFIIAPIILVFPGLIVLNEAYTRIKIGIEISPWFPS